MVKSCICIYKGIYFLDTFFYDNNVKALSSYYKATDMHIDYNNVPANIINVL